MKVYAYPVPMAALMPEELPDGEPLIDPASIELELPVGAEVIAVEPSSKSLVTLYAIVDPDAPTETREFAVLGNGVDLPEDEGHPDHGLIRTYRGTVKVIGGPTWHVFELVKVGAPA